LGSTNYHPVPKRQCHRNTLLLADVCANRSADLNRRNWWRLKKQLFASRSIEPIVKNQVRIQLKVVEIGKTSLKDSVTPNFRFGAVSTSLQ
jgi:hypothetical protein